MKSINVVGLNYENRQVILNEIIDSFDGKLMKNNIELEKEPNNKHDPKAIKVMMYDNYGDKHHIGYIPREETKYVHDNLKLIKRINADVGDGIVIHLVSIANGNPFLKAGDGSRKTKITNRIGCGLMLFILLMIILIIFI